jgi:hypothetical protein
VLGTLLVANLQPWPLFLGLKFADGNVCLYLNCRGTRNLGNFEALGGMRVKIA